MNYEDYRRGLINKEVIISAIKQKEENKSNSKSVKTHKSKYLQRVDKFANRAVKSKAVLRHGSQVTVLINQPVYTKDRSRYFNEALEEEKKQLFFR